MLEEQINVEQPQETIDSSRINNEELKRMSDEITDIDVRIDELLELRTKLQSKLMDELNKQ